eukprot:SAG25_NODE_3520_length_1053_cov_1.102725_1_plen_110_part_10
MLSNDHSDVSLDGDAGTEHQLQHRPYPFTTLQEMAADAAAEETLRLFEQDFEDDTWLVYLAALWQLYELIRDDYRWPDVSRAPLLLSIYYRATDIESNIDPWQTGIPIDS